MKMRNIKCAKNIIKYRSDWPSGGPRESHVGVMLGSSWPFDGIVQHLNIIYPPKINLRGGESHWEGGLPGPGGPRGGVGEGFNIFKGWKPSDLTRP